MALLECKNLSIGYGSTIIQDKISFSINQGDYFYIIGENGSGKSTLLRTLLGFEKPISGTIDYSEAWNKKEIGYLSQTSEIQKTFPATVWEIVLSGCQANLKFHPFYTRNDVQLAKSNLKKMGMSSFVKRSFKELSGGQQQRVLLARTLCAARSILILDEPSKGFDSDITETMYKIIQELNHEGKTIITISHDQSAAEKYGNHILKLGKSWELVK